MSYKHLLIDIILKIFIDIILKYFKNIYPVIPKSETDRLYQLYYMLCVLGNCKTVPQSKCLVLHSYKQDIRKFTILTNTWFIYLFSILRILVGILYKSKQFSFAFPRYSVVWNTFTDTDWLFIFYWGGN